MIIRLFNLIRGVVVKINACKDCLYYNDCIRDSEDINNPPALRERLYIIFVEGYDCFHRINRDWE